jgi:glutathione synthase/RimK-type ligase-like ATP-grasp enzyme
VSRVAIATCHGVDVDPDSPTLLAALSAVGVKGELAVWDDPSVDWSHFDAVVIRSTWDYWSGRAEFLAWAKSIKHLFNPYPIIEYSTDKHYLADLEKHGLRIIPSHFCDRGKKPRFFDHDFVVKPCVGAGSRDADRYRADQHDEARRHVETLHAKGLDAVLQPYVDSVDTDGERAMIFIDGAFSHAMTKLAMLNVTQLDRNNLYREEQIFADDAEPDAVAYAEHVLEVKGFSHLLYARVDLVRLGSEWAIMELELVEPSLYLRDDEHAASKLATAIAKRLH